MYFTEQVIRSFWPPTSSSSSWTNCSTKYLFVRKVRHPIIRRPRECDMAARNILGSGKEGTQPHSLRDAEEKREGGEEKEEWMNERTPELLLQGKKELRDVLEWQDCQPTSWKNEKSRVLKMPNTKLARQIKCQTLKSPQTLDNEQTIYYFNSLKVQCQPPPGNALIVESGIEN